jgi:hypothetical protein
MLNLNFVTSCGIENCLLSQLCRIPIRTPKLTTLEHLRDIMTFVGTGIGLLVKNSRGRKVSIRSYLINKLKPIEFQPNWLFSYYLIKNENIIQLSGRKWNMTQNFFTKATGIEQYDNTQEMNTTLFPENLQDVFTKVISSHLHIDHINNLYGSCKEMNKQLHQSITYIYKKICLHHQPHSIDDLPAVIKLNGNQEWYKEGKQHRDGDLPAVILSNGSQCWYKEGKLHRDGDLPASIYSNGSQCWYKEGKQHRDGDLPAVIYSDGNQHWYKEGKQHRDGDLPAMILSNGSQCWYKEGKLHRDGDLPASIYSNGSQCWYKEGKQHRDGDLPAVIYSDGNRCWYKEGKQHRDGDLPAVILSNGSQCWYKEGKLHRDGDLPAAIYSNGD